MPRGAGGAAGGASSWAQVLKGAEGVAREGQVACDEEETGDKGGAEGGEAETRFTSTDADAYGSIRQHTSAYVSIRREAENRLTSSHPMTVSGLPYPLQAHVKGAGRAHTHNQHTSAYVSIRTHNQHTSVYVSIRAHNQHTSAYVSIQAEHVHTISPTLR